MMALLQETSARGHGSLQMSGSVSAIQYVEKKDREVGHADMDSKTIALAISNCSV